MADLLQLVSQAVQQNINWKEIEAALPIFAVPMSQTEQNPLYHAEGDVWTHTKMVCEELVKLSDFNNLSEDRQRAVFLAALLHDIGKISTTRLENDQLTSPSHTVVGARMARRFLWQDIDLCGTQEKQQFRETVCLLIRYHGTPPHVPDDRNGKRKLLAIAANGQLCPLFTIELLCILCEADALGRVCEDTQNRLHMLEQVQLCREYAKELGCYTAPFSFPSAHTRFSYLSCLSRKRIPPEVELYDDTWGEVILMAGLPGTGKDTWIQKNCPELPMVSLDEIRKEMNVAPTEKQSEVAKLARERALELLRNKQPFVWNATDLTVLSREKKIRMFTEYHASVRIVFLETAWEEELRRNRNRAAVVPKSVICSMLEILVPPEVQEAQHVEWHCV